MSRSRMEPPAVTPFVVVAGEREIVSGIFDSLDIIFISMIHKFQILNNTLIYLFFA